MDLDAFMAQLNAPFAAFELRENGGHHIFADLPAVARWALDRKRERHLSLRDTELVWGDAEGERRAVITFELARLKGGSILESWRVLTTDANAAVLMAAIKTERASRREAA